MANIEEVENRLSKVENIMNGWVAGGTDPYFNYMKTKAGEFDYGPGGVAYLANGAAQSIPNNTLTALSWSSMDSTRGYPDFRPPPPITWSSAASSEIRVIGKPNEHMFKIWGHIEWAANTSGRRTVAVRRNFGGSSFGGDTINSQGPAPDGNIIQPFVLTWKSRPSSATGDQESFLTVSVLQQSGDSLNVNFAVVSVFKLW